MKRLALLCLIAACEHAAPAPPPVAPEVAPWTLRADVNGKERDVLACGSECRAGRRAACARGHAWTVDYALGKQEFHLVVSDAELGTVEFQGRRLLGVDGSLWLACLPACGTPPACVPYVFPVALGFDSDGSCKTSEADGPAWHGHPTKIVTHHCGELEIHFTSVPELLEVDNALRAIGIVDGPMFDGLVVSGRIGDGEPFTTITEVAPADCAAFDLPADARVREREQDYRQVIEAQPALQAGMLSHATELKAMMEEIYLALMQKLSARCFTDGLVHGPEEIDACLKTRAEIPLGGADVNEILGKMLAESSEYAAKADQLTSDYLDRPLCERVGL